MILRHFGQKKGSCSVPCGSKARAGGFVPAWSTEIANEFIRLAAGEGNAFTQMHLQELVYIAHGWCLALTGQPLTGDRPEATEHGPEYRILADALASSGAQRVESIIGASNSKSKTTKTEAVVLDEALEPDERAIVVQVYANYGRRSTAELAALTRGENTPWAHTFAGGSGIGRDVSHRRIGDQFAEIASRLRR